MAIEDRAFDILTELVRAILAGVVLILMLAGSRRKGLRGIPGWKTVLAGLAFLFFAMVIDITDNFPQLNRFVVIGSTPVEAFLEKICGYLLGMALLALGFYQWIPSLLQLYEAREKLSATLDGIGDAVIATDAEGRITIMNPVACRLTGWKAEEALGEMVGKVLRMKDADTQAPVEPIVPEVLRTGRKSLIPEVCVLVPREGRETIVAGAAAPLRGPRGEIQGAALMFRDMTHQIEIEEQLRQSQKMDAIGRLAGGIAHDFNNMLGVIIGNIELALPNLPKDHPVVRNIEEIKAATEHSATLTRQLTAFARKQTVAPKILDLNAAIVDIMKMLQRLIGENVNLVWKPQANIWPVKIDPSQLMQIMANLCANARDAIGSSGTITIETGSRLFDHSYCENHIGCTPGDFAMVAVADTGCGMPEEVLAHIFEPFFTTKDSGKGTGLGLATVYGAVRQNNGFILVESDPGKGTRFEIYLPRCRETAPAPARDSKAAQQWRGTETILLVEDDRQFRKVAETMLAQKGYKVLAAATPADAFRMAEENGDGISLMVSDVVMPDINGKELADKLRPAHPEMKVLFMSGYPSDIITEQGVLDEGLHFIGKPFSLQDLARKIREILDEEESTGSN